MLTCEDVVEFVVSLVFLYNISNSYYRIGIEQTLDSKPGPLKTNPSLRTVPISFLFKSVMFLHISPSTHYVRLDCISQNKIRIAD